MGVADCFKKLKLREWVCIAFFIISLAMLIAGAVMLGIAIRAAEGPFPTFDFPTCPTLGNPKSLYSTSFASGINWDDSLNDPSSSNFQSLASSLKANISKAWTNPYQAEYDIQLPPLITDINAFSKGQNGVNFYSSFLFVTNDVTANDLQNVISAQGYPTNAFTSPTSQCTGLLPETPSTNPTQTPVSGATNQPATNQPQTSPTPVQSGAYCDASKNVLVNVFLVDVSVPIIGTLDDKLAKISNYLNNASSTINLDQQASWSSQEFRLVIYGGNEPIPLGRARNQATWSKIVASLNSTIVNPNNRDKHNMEDALQYVSNNYLPSNGVAVNVIVVADGFNLNEAYSISTVANVIKNQYSYSLGIILMSTSQVLQGAVSPLASDFFHFYPIDNADYLQNVAVQKSQALWACQAYYPTPAPPTPAPTRIPLQTTAATATTPAVRTTANPLAPSLASCKQNVVFLIEQSQTMLLSGYDIAVQYSIKLANSLYNLNQDSTFAFIIYNQAIVSQSSAFTGLSDFTNQINSAPKKLGNTDAVIGFNASLDFISTKSNYSDPSTRPILVYLTDGNNLDGKTQQTSTITKQIRAKYQTQVLGIDLSETAQNALNVQQVIQYQSNDAYVSSVYVGVPQPLNILDDKLLNSTIYQLKCKDNSNCNVDLTFVIETSEAEGPNFVDIQIRAVNNIITHYIGSINPMKIAVSLVYFSSPDGLIDNQQGVSGILYQQVTDGQQAINTLNTTTFSPLGGASDLQLGFSLTAQSLKQAFIQNSKFVVFFARGAYEQFSNCCPDPTSDAANVRSLATVQGVVIGPYSNKLQLDLLTGSSSVDANQIIGNSDLNSTDARASVAARISDQIIPLIQSFISQQQCSQIADFINPPCEEPIDALILLHADDANNWAEIINFVATQLIPDLVGSTGQPSNKTLTTSYPINIAIASYYYLDVRIWAEFTYLRSTQDYVSLAQSLPFYKTAGTATLSTAYKKAVSIFNDGRPYASKNLILITDTMDISDMEDAFSEHDAMVQQVGGYTSALTINANTIPGADFQMNIDPVELDTSNQFASRQLANALTVQTCNYNPVKIPTQPPTEPVPTLPGTIPVVKSRLVWPDITILIDTSIAPNGNFTGMDDIVFEKIRNFLKIWLEQYSVGEKGSKFTLATFDGQYLDFSCKFIEINNYFDLDACRNQRLSFYDRNHESNRDVGRALGLIRKIIYESSDSGFRALNENFLVLFTLGSSSTAFNSELVNIQRKGVRTIAVGLSDSMSNNDLSAFAQTAFMIPDWKFVYSGIDTNYDLADRLIQTTTKKRTPSTTTFYANLVFIVDQSLSTSDSHADVVQYVSDSVGQFLIDPLKTSISIVPFADNVISPLALSSSQDSVDQYLTSWKTSTTSSSSVSNIGTAIQYVYNQFSTSNGKPTYVVYVIGADNATGTELSKQLMRSVGNVYVANYNLNAQSYAQNLVFDTRNVFTVSNSNQLLNRVVSYDQYSQNQMLALTTDILLTQQAQDSVFFPLSAIAADIVILLDETGLSDDDFARTKNFLSDFTKYFHIGPTSTQFALQAYNGRTIPHDGFHLFESTTGDVVRTKISQLTLAKATENSTDADLAGAIEQELYFFLTEKNGWRDDATTFTIILTHADSFYDRDTSIAMSVKNLSSVFALATNGQKFDYVSNFTNTNFYETVDSVSNLSTDSAAVQDLLTTIDNTYKNLVYPEPINVRLIVKADFIFLVDHALGRGYTDTVQNFLFDFITSVGKFSNSGNDSRIAVVNYDSTGAVPSWTLAAAQDATSIRNNIFKFEILGSSGTSNLRSAIDSVILNENDFGVNPNRPTYFIVIAGSDSIQPSIDVRTTRQLNTRYSTFVIQTDSNNLQYSYVPQVLGTQLTSDRIVHDQNLKFSDIQFVPFTSWISNEYSAWTNTYPDKSN